MLVHVVLLSQIRSVDTVLSWSGSSQFLCKCYIMSDSLSQCWMFCGGMVRTYHSAQMSHWRFPVARMFCRRSVLKNHSAIALSLREKREKRITVLVVLQFDVLRHFANGALTESKEFVLMSLFLRRTAVTQMSYQHVSQSWVFCVWIYMSDSANVALMV